jgi:hypothetical protein
MRLAGAGSSSGLAVPLEQARSQLGRGVLQGLARSLAEGAGCRELATEQQEREKESRIICRVADYGWHIFNRQRHNE